MLLLLLSGQSAVIASGDGLATGQSTVVGHGVAGILPPLGLLLLYQDNAPEPTTFIRFGDGSSIGTSSVLAHTRILKGGDGLATGISTVLGRALSVATGISEATSSVQAFSGTFVPSFASGLSTGSSLVNAESNATKASRGDASGSSTIFGASTTAQTGIASGLSTGTSSVLGRTLSVFQGLSVGTSSVQAFTGSIYPSVGGAAGVGTATARSPATSSADGEAHGISFVSARGEVTSIAVGEHFLPTSLKLEFQKQAFTLFTAVRIQYKFYTFHALDSSGIVTLNGEQYSGRDPGHGTIMSIDVISDGTGDDAPAVRIVLMPPDALASSNIIDPGSQGGIVQIFIGAVEPLFGSGALS